MAHQIRKANQQARQPQFLLRSLEDGRTFDLSGEMLVGREADCDIFLTSRHVSRYQAKLQVTPLGVMVEDLVSTNGTYVNGRRISSPRLLSVGDEVSFYATRFILVEARAVQEDEGTLIDSVHLREDAPRARAPATEPRPAFRVRAPVEDDAEAAAEPSTQILPRTPYKRPKSEKPW